jgi:hypothetical protein
LVRWLELCGGELTVQVLDEQDGTVLDDAAPVLGFLLLVQRTSDAATRHVLVTNCEIISRYVSIRAAGRVEAQLDDSGTHTSTADYKAQTLRRRGAHVSH